MQKEAAAVALRQALRQRSVSTMTEHSQEGFTDIFVRPAKRPRYKAPEVWLDLLSIDVCARISSMLSPRHPARRRDRYIRRKSAYPADRMKLARVSDMQREAAVVAQQRALRLHLNDLDYPLRLLTFWGDLLGNELCELHLPNCGDYKFAQVARKLLSRPSLRKVRIPHSAMFIRPIHAAGSVRDIALVHTRVGELGNFHNQVALAEVLHACPVEELTICSETDMVSQPRLSAMKALAALRGRPTSLRALRLVSSSIRYPTVATAMTLFPNLEALHLENFERSVFNEIKDDRTFLPNPAIDQQLLALKSVSMINCGRVDRFASLLGTRLRKLASSCLVSCCSIRKLKNCPKLELLRLVLEPGAEDHLPTNLCSLQSVSLSWAPVRQNLIPSPKEEFFTGLLRRNKQLHTLHLKVANILFPIREDIAVRLGDRLRSLELPISSGFRPDLDSIIGMLRLIIQHNRNISHLALVVSHYGPLSDVLVGCTEHEGRKLASTDECVSCKDCQLWQRVNRILQLLKRRLLRLNGESLEKLRCALGLGMIAKRNRRIVGLDTVSKWN